MSTKLPGDKSLAEEFAEFMKCESYVVPPEVGEKILRRVTADLNPSAWTVFSKVGVVQAIVGLVSLLFCPQFGFSLTGSHGIMHFFMQFGMSVCMAACGTLFVGTSLLISALVLRADEVRVLRRNRILQVAALSLLTAGAFFCLGAEVLELVTLAWLGGAILGGMGTLELGWRARQGVRKWVMYG